MPCKHEHYLIAFLFMALLVSMVFGCAQPQQVVRTEYIATPSYCQVAMPEKPVIKKDLSTMLDYSTFLSNLRAMMIYTDQLEMALLCCQGSDDCISKPGGR